MSSTPEGRVKRQVTDYLKSLSGLYYFMPVPSGYGKSTLDYIGCYRGLLFAIETKAPGKHPTNRQKQIISAIERAGGAVFVTDGDITALKQWVESVQ